MAGRKRYSNLWRHRYAVYSRKFKEVEKKLDPIYEKLSFKDFKYAFIETREKIEIGELKQPNRGITAKLVDNSFYSHSYKEARALWELEGEALRAKGFKFQELRREEYFHIYDEFLYERIKSDRAELFAQGLSAKEVRKEIGKRYWKSE